MSMTTWHIEIQFDEDDTNTRAALTVRLPDGGELRSRGYARRNPTDRPRASIGEEVAAARALNDLTHQLLDRAAGEISEATHQPAHLMV